MTLRGSESSCIVAPSAGPPRSRWRSTWIAIVHLAMPLAAQASYEPPDSETLDSQVIACAESDVRQKYPTAFTMSARYSERRETASHLLADAMTCKSQEYRFVLIREAARVAEAALDFELLDRVVVEQAQRFGTSRWEESQQAMERICSRLTTKHLLELRGSSTLESLEAYAKKALAEQQLVVGKSVADSIKMLAARMISNALIDKSCYEYWILVGDEIRDWAGRWTVAIDRLGVDQDDVEANRDIGTCLCVLSGNWEAGLQFLRRGPDAYARAAAFDLESPTTALERRVLADLWKSLAGMAPARTVTTWESRAKLWYELALPELDEPAAFVVRGELRTIESKLRSRAGTPCRSIKSTTFAERAVLDRQLLLNAGAERSESNGNVHGWEIVTGNWRAKSDIRPGDPEVRFGESYFWPESKDAVAELRQCVDVSVAAQLIDDGRIGVRLSGHVASYSQNPGDESEMVVAFLDENREPLCDALSTGRIYSPEWVEQDCVGLVPIGTRYLRVALVSWRRGRGTKNNEGAFDQLSLRLTRDFEHNP